MAMTVAGAVVMVAGLIVVVLALAGTDAEPPPKLSTPDTVPAAPISEVTGCWAVTTGPGTFVGYRANEQLAGLTTTRQATGRTNSVNGGIVIDENELVAAAIAADLQELESDEVDRDEALRTQGLQTDTHPNAVFTLTEPVPVPATVDGGVAVDLVAHGELTLHGVRAPITVSLEGQVLEADGARLIELVGSAPIHLADFGIEPPVVLGVLTVADDAVLELRLELSEDPTTCTAIERETAAAGGSPS
jgi:polyisoprenoid-binding protein YceI